jgi:hypothetical protein
MISLLIALKIIPMIFMALFPVVNPIGTALILFGMTQGVDDQVWKSMSRRIALYSFLFFRQLHSQAFWNIHSGGSVLGRDGIGINGMATLESKRNWLIVLFVQFGMLAPRNLTAILSLIICAISMTGAIYLILN